MSCLSQPPSHVNSSLVDVVEHRDTSPSSLSTSPTTFFTCHTPPDSQPAHSDVPPTSELAPDLTCATSAPLSLYLSLLRRVHDVLSPLVNEEYVHAAPAGPAASSALSHTSACTLLVSTLQSSRGSSNATHSQASDGPQREFDSARLPETRASQRARWRPAAHGAPLANGAPNRPWRFYVTQREKAERRPSWPVHPTCP